MCILQTETILHRDVTLEKVGVEYFLITHGRNRWDMNTIVVCAAGSEKDNTKRRKPFVRKKIKGWSSEV